MKARKAGFVVFLLAVSVSWAAGCGGGESAGTATGGQAVCRNVCSQYQQCDPTGFAGQYVSMEECVNECLNEPMYTNEDPACDEALRDLAGCVGGLECADYDTWTGSDACADTNMPCYDETLAVVDSCGTGCGATETVCDDGLDNDNDGLTDCNDTDCRTDPVCQGQVELVCDDGVDDDNDGDTDCDDADCNLDPTCQGQVETDCTDGVDNDNDGATDCADSNCDNDPACQGLTETVCDDQVDDDNDGDTDCEDLDCFTDPVCQGLVEIMCDDQQDNDNDGDTDCDDADCLNFPVCGGTGWTCADILACAEQCENYQCMMACRENGCPSGQDAMDAFLGCMAQSCGMQCMNDIGSQECQDCLAQNCSDELADCAADACTIQTEIDCTDGVDNDNDGDTDCGDADCLADPACGGDLTCSEIQICVNACGNDFQCRQDCRQAGCPSGQYFFDELFGCIRDNCGQVCMQDPQGQACQDCIAQNCSTEAADCAGDDCTAVVTEIDCGNNVDDDNDGDTDCDDSDCANEPSCQPESNCSDNVDNDSDGDTDCDDTDCQAAPICATGNQTCQQIYQCVLACQWDSNCIAACRAAGCGSGQILYDQVMVCMQDNCFNPCNNNPLGNPCNNCMNNNCGTELTACTADDCSGAGVELNCGNNVDDDSDGDTDCDDPDCQSDPVCGGGGNLSCTEIQTCVIACGWDQQCRQECVADGCATAQAAYDALRICIQDNSCWACYQDPQSQQCLDCLSQNCPTEAATCQSNTCP